MPGRLHRLNEIIRLISTFTVIAFVVFAHAIHRLVELVDVDAGAWYRHQLQQSPLQGDEHLAIK